jgi:hypothetical protein
MHEAYLLSTDVLAAASLRGNEYAWPLAQVEAAIDDARHHGLAVSGGQAQVRLPNGGTYEFDWIELDSSARRAGEPWAEYVGRSANEALAKLHHHLVTVDWAKLIREWPGQGCNELMAADATEHLCFVLYFKSEGSACGAAG